ncbi:MAG TPA: hypothetical protein VGR62_24150 [Candidatus Binatia bacterium]|jgi:hypothetical protein|nr:hypothetical protein [Candidatus Binatia bacterium]
MAFATVVGLTALPARATDTGLPVTRLAGKAFTFEYPQAWRLWNDEATSGAVSVSLKRPVPCAGEVVTIVDLTIRTAEEPPDTPTTSADLKDLLDFELSAVDMIEKETATTQLGKVSGRGVQITGTVDGGKAQMRLVSFFHDLGLAGDVMNPTARRAFRVTGLWMTACDGKPVMSAEESNALEHFLGSIALADGR